MMEGVPVTLIVKASHQQIKDQIIKCDDQWTVKRLKEHLSEVYPNKPESSKQKLIYSGRLLSDSSYLKDVLRKDLENQSHIVHLVCALPKSGTGGAIPTQTNVENHTSSNTRNDTEEFEHIDAQNSNQSNENDAQRQAPSTQTFINNPYLNNHNSQQIAWMQQAYLHYLTQYIQLMAAQGIYSIPYVPQMNVGDNMYMNNNNNNNNVGNEPPQALLAQDAGDINLGGINNNNNAGDDAGFQRDWLDLFYLLTRLFILICIIYFYSSPLRFLMVTFLGFAIYLCQGGFFRIQPMMLPENNNINLDNNNQAFQNEMVGAEAVIPPQNVQVPDVQPEARTNTNENNEEVRPGALTFTWTFFSSFFTSFIPDQANMI